MAWRMALQRRVPVDRMVELRGLANLTPLSVTTGSNDPARTYAWFRERWGDIAPVELEPGVPAWYVMGYRDIAAITRSEQFSRDPARWSAHREGLVAPASSLNAFAPPRALRHCFHADGSEHDRLRAPVDDAFAALDDVRLARLVQDVCEATIERFGPPGSEGAVDLVEDYSVPVAIFTLTSILGIPAGEAPGIAKDLGIVWSFSDEAAAAERRLAERAMTHVAARKAASQDDLTSAYARHPGFTDPREIADTIFATIGGGHEATAALITQTLCALLGDARLAGRVTTGRLAVDDALDSVLWNEPPGLNAPGMYFALEDMLMGNKLVRAGDALVMGLGAANHDPEVRTGDDWELVGNRAHLAWSTGPHRCPAVPQARIIARVAVRTILQRLDLNLAVAPDEIPWSPSQWMRYKAQLPVRFRRPVLAGDRPTAFE